MITLIQVNQNMKKMKSKNSLTLMKNIQQKKRKNIKNPKEIHKVVPLKLLQIKNKKITNFLNKEVVC